MVCPQLVHEPRPHKPYIIFVGMGDEQPEGRFLRKEETNEGIDDAMGPNFATTT